jgi:hypothetical protein
MNVPAAPRVGSQGTSTPGGHFVAYKAQAAFAPEATLELTDGANHWRPNTPGARFWDAALSKAKTVAQAIELAGKANIKSGEAQKHLRWYFTWGYLRVDGVAYQVQPRAKAPAKARKAKATS